MNRKVLERMKDHDTDEANEALQAEIAAEQAAMMTFTFKNEKLNAYSVEIAAIRDEMGNVNVKLAKVLGHVKTDKCYEDDGFKSVAEYAEKTFKIKRSMAYQLAAVGERFYNSDNETAQKVAEMLPPSNLSEIVKLTDDQLNVQMQSGTISENSTQASLREVATHVKEAESPAKPKVLKQYVADVTLYGQSTIERKHFDRITMEELPSAIGINAFIVKTFQKLVDKGPEKSAGLDIWATPDGAVVRVEYTTYITPAASTRAEHKAGEVKTYTRAELEAMLAALPKEDQEQGE